MTSSPYGISLLDNFAAFVTQKIKAKSRGIHFYYSRKISTLELDHKKELTDLESIHDKAITYFESNHYKAITDLESKHNKIITDLESKHNKAITDLESNHNKAITDLESKHNKVITDLETNNKKALSDFRLRSDEEWTRKFIEKEKEIIALTSTISIPATVSLASKRPAIEPVLSELEPKKSKNKHIEPIIEHTAPITSYSKPTSYIDKNTIPPSVPLDTYDTTKRFHPGLNRRIPNPTDHLKTVESSYVLGVFDFVVDINLFNDQSEWIEFCSNYIIDFINNDLYDKRPNYKYSLIQIHGVIGRFCGRSIYYNIRNNISAPIIEHLTKINRYKPPG